MSVRDTFDVYNPVTVLLGCGFAGSGLWLAIEYAVHGKHNVVGVCFIGIWVILLITLGVAILHKQLMLRRQTLLQNARGNSELP
jgi:hypothetical protein